MCGANAALVLVVQQAIDADLDVAVTEQHTAVAVVQTFRANLQCSGGNRAFDRGQCVVEGQGEFLVAQQLAAAVVQRLGDQFKSLVAGNLAATVVHVGEVFQQQLLRRVDHAALVIQRAAVQIDADSPAAEQLAALLVEALDIGGQCLAGAEAATGIGHLSGSDVDVVVSVNVRLVVVECTGIDAEIGLAADHTFLLVIQRAAVEGEIAIGQQAAALVADGATRVDGQRFGAGDGAGVVVEASGVDRQGAFVDEAALCVVQIPGEIDREVFLAGQATTVFQRLAAQRQPGITGQQAFIAVDDVVDGQRQIASREHVTAVAVIEPGADQADIALARQLAAAVVDTLDVELQRISRTDQTFLTVIQTRGDDRQAVVGDDHAVLVIEHASHAEINIAPHTNVTAAVVQTVAATVEAGGGDQAFDVAQCAVDDQDELLIAEQFAAVVVQALRVDAPGLGGGDFAGAVVDVLEVFQQQLTRRMNIAALVVEQTVVHVQGQVAVAEQLAAVLFQRGQRSFEFLLTAEAAAGVVQVRGGQ
ncbi:hypothetical protein D3C72_331760 [compost metagenome]